MAKNRHSDVDSDPGFTVIGLPAGAKKGTQRKPLSLTYSSREAAEVAKSLLDKAGATETYIREVGKPIH